MTLNFTLKMTIFFAFKSIRNIKICHFNSKRYLFLIHCKRKTISRYEPSRDTKVNLSSRIWRNTYISKHRFLETNGSGFRLLFTCQYWDFSAVMSIDPYLISEELLERDQPWVTNNEHPIFYSYTCIKTVEPKVQ